jgi:3-oxoacyl-[acyl-carrier protein] reductase
VPANDRALLGLEGAVALVTGASRGIGAATAVWLARAGAHVCVNYRERADAAEAVVARIVADGGQAFAHRADVVDAAAVAAMVGAVHERYGPVTVLVNNAFPGFQGGDVAEVDWSVFERQIEGILKGAYVATRAVLPDMRAAKKGRIVNVGTTSLYDLNERHTPYVSAKGALLAFTRGLARDLGPDGICVNYVSPGLTWRETDRPQPEEFGPRHRARTPMGRNPDADDLARAILFFCSDLAGFVTGVHLPVCGGLVMHVG